MPAICATVIRCDNFRSNKIFTEELHGEKTMMPLIVIGILVVGAIFILAGMYNSLVQLRVRADSCMVRY